MIGWLTYLIPKRSFKRNSNIMSFGYKIYHFQIDKNWLNMLRMTSCICAFVGFMSKIYFTWILYKYKCSNSVVLFSCRLEVGCKFVIESEIEQKINRLRLFRLTDIASKLQVLQILCNNELKILYFTIWLWLQASTASLLFWKFPPIITFQSVHYTVKINHLLKDFGHIKQLSKVFNT